MKTAKTGIILLSSALVMGAGLADTVMPTDDGNDVATSHVTQQSAGGGGVTDGAQSNSTSNVGNAIAGTSDVKSG